MAKRKKSTVSLEDVAKDPSAYIFTMENGFELRPAYKSTERVRTIHRLKHRAREVFGDYGCIIAPRSFESFGIVIDTKRQAIQDGDCVIADIREVTEDDYIIDQQTYGKGPLGDYGFHWNWSK